MANWPPNTFRLCSHTAVFSCSQTCCFFFNHSSFGFIYLLTAQTACLHLTSQAPTADKERNWSSCYLFFFFFFLPTILLSRTFPLSELRYQSPGSSDFRNWLSATPAAFTASSSKIPSLTAMSGEQLYGSTRK